MKVKKKGGGKPRKKGGKIEQKCTFHLLLLLLWLFSTKKNNNLTNILQHHPAVVLVSMVIAIRLPIKDSQNNIISIAFYLNQRHHIIYSTYLIDCYQFRLYPVSSINHPLVVVTLCSTCCLHITPK